jgi:aldehyde dehydrogenase
VVNVVNGFGDKALTSNRKVAKFAFTDETNTGKIIMKKTANYLIPATMGLRGKSPNIFFSSIADHDDELFDKAVEGAVLLFAFNQGELCICQSRILVQEDIYEKFK